MRFGSSDRFALEIDPRVPTWERRYAPERTAWAALAVWVQGQNLCAHSERGTDRVVDAFNVPLAPIADWLVRSWPYVAFEERAAQFAQQGGLHETRRRWGSHPPRHVSEDEWFDQRAQWWQRHFLAAGAHGAILPDLALAREDEQLLLEWRPPRLGSVELLAPAGSGRVAWDEATEVLETFVNYVRNWLKDEGQPALYPWMERPSPLDAAALAWSERVRLYTGRSFTELAALVGGCGDADLARGLGLAGVAADPASSPVTQVLRDLPPALPGAAGHTLRQLDDATQTARRASVLDRLRGAARDAGRDAATPEDAGYAAARMLRAEVNLDGQPLPEGDLREFLNFLDIEVRLDDSDVGGARMFMGRRDGLRSVAFVLHSPRTCVRWGQRFEAARALGHALLDPSRDGVVGAASSPFAQVARRRRSGAFAAELLLPVSALQRETRGVLDEGAKADVFERLLEAYGVGARTAAQQLFNHDFLSSDEIRDQLVDEFAAQAD